MELDQISRLIDIVCFATISFMVVKGFANGLIVELGFLASLALSYYLADGYGSELGRQTIGLVFPNSTLLHSYIGCFAIVAVVMILSSIVYRMISDRLSQSGARSVIAILGAFIAFVKSIFICVFGLQFTSSILNDHNGQFEQARANSNFQLMFEILKNTVVDGQNNIKDIAKWTISKEGRED